MIILVAMKLLGTTRKCSEVTLLDQVLVASNGKSMLYTGCKKECKKMRLGLMRRCI